MSRVDQWADENWRRACWTELLVTLRSQGTCALPPETGSTLRGAFGHALQRHACWRAPAICQGGCAKPHACAYGALWESSPGVRGDPPKPFVFAPDGASDGASDNGAGEPKTTFAAGDCLRFSLRLIGESRPWAPWVFGALAEPWRLGAARAPWSLERVEVVPADGRPVTIFHHVGDIPTEIGRGVNQRVRWPLRTAEVLASPPWDDEPLRIRLVTPLDWKRRGERVNRIDGAELAVRVVDRMTDLVDIYCGGADRDEWRHVRSAAERVRTVSGQLHRARWERYSSTTGGRHPLTGLLGELVVEAVPEAVRPYLVLGQFLHVGRCACFGQGRYRLGPVKAQAPVPCRFPTR